MNSHPPLTERIGTASGTEHAHDGSAGAAPTQNRVTVAISGPGFSDSEAFETVDVRGARASARKLMGSAIRLFGKAEGADAE